MLHGYWVQLQFAKKMRMSLLCPQTPATQSTYCSRTCLHYYPRPEVSSRRRNSAPSPSHLTSTLWSPQARALEKLRLPPPTHLSLFFLHEPIAAIVFCKANHKSCEYNAFSTKPRPQRPAVRRSLFHKSSAPASCSAPDSCFPASMDCRCAQAHSLFLHVCSKER